MRCASVRLTPERTCEDRRMGYEWEDGHELSARIDGQQIVIAGNAAGLKSLAGHLLVLASADVDPGSHLHLDEFSGLEDGSTEVILERTSLSQTEAAPPARVLRMAPELRHFGRCRSWRSRRSRVLRSTMS